MHRIELVDNNLGQVEEERTYDWQVVKPLFEFSNKTVKEICQEHRHILVFPTDIERSKDRIDKMTVLKMSYASDQDHVKIETGNVMGFFGTSSLQVNIRSRFDKQRTGDFLLHYMLQKVFSFNLFNLNHKSSNEDVFDFLLYLFPIYLKEALRQGIYREYKRFDYNDPHFHGTFDVSRHINRNIPFVGNIAYSTREYTYDNWVTQLIRHTIEYIRLKEGGSYVLHLDSETRECVETICKHTPSYSLGYRQKIIE